VKRLPLPLSTVAIACAVLGAPAVTRAAVPVLLTGSFITPAATAQQAAICPGGEGYPAQPIWGASSTVLPPRAAAAGVPRIVQYRAGKPIAIYKSFNDQPGCTYKLDGTDFLHPAAPATSGCGPFTHSKGWRLWLKDDQFYVYPAVYDGIYNSFGLSEEWNSPATYPQDPIIPKDISIIGVVQRGVRPVIVLDAPVTQNTLMQSAVYFGLSSGITMSNIDIVEKSATTGASAGIYLSQASNLTLRNIRITGFSATTSNGLFAATDNAGTLLLDQVELDHNGGSGPSGLAHNAYINASSIDPSFAVSMLHSWTHDAVSGHLFKTRAPINSFVGNYFQGGVPASGATQAESYLLDVPNGGQLTLRDNIFAKNQSGVGTNGVSVTYAVEGIPDRRPLNIDIENNSFVTYAKTFDGTTNNMPFNFYNPAVEPGSSQWPATVPYRIIKNAYVGYCPTGSAAFDYRGDIYAEEAFTELSPEFSLLTKVYSKELDLERKLKNYTPIYKTPAYAHEMQTGLIRKLPTLGAQD
jgi:hypothetical protein